MKWFKTKTFSI